MAAEVVYDNRIRFMNSEIAQNVGLSAKFTQLPHTALV